MIVPTHGKLSSQYSEDSVIFCKVDADVARDVITANGIKAFPTFKVMKDDTSIYQKGGFDQGAIVRALEENGAQKAGAGGSKPSMSVAAEPAAADVKKID